VFDYQTRIPTDYFGINAGERGLIFKYDSGLYGNDVWTAFHSLADYARGNSPYSDQNYVVDIDHYEMNIDLRQPKKRMGLQTKIRMQPTIRNLRAISFSIGENLGEYDEARLKKQMRVKSVRMETAQADVIQEDWESGFTVFLPSGLKPDAPFEIEIDLEGDFLRQPEPTDPSRGRISESFSDCSYPRSNSAWYPRHGYLDRSTFNFVFTHPKKLKVASTGTRVSELPAASDKEMVETKYVMNFPVALATFALGPWERHVDSIKWENGDKPTPLEFNSLSTENRTIKEDFILAELNNSVRYFQALFGKYPYETYGAVFHPYRFGQGFATMLTIPGYSAASKYNYVFFAHETAHQWWGNIVLWRSYRDQWLSEGFAEYSGVAYTNLRDGPKSSADLIDLMRRSLRDPPQTETGPGKGKLVDVGPLVLGHRLESKKTYGAYNTLVYNKGALVLRMIHFLMTNPANGDGKPFYDMMKDFVERHRNKIASTDDFRIVANEHFARTPVAAKYGLKNLDWFFQQWVYETALPSYSLAYQIQGQPDGTAIVTGTVTQDNAPERWFMPLPVVYKLGGGKVAYGTVGALGPKAPFTLRLPVTPVSMELDPQRWVLSANTSTK
jgi:aminopeptidase N